jgi:putative nucleotidyltransferase with HDIG domain
MKPADQAHSLRVLHSLRQQGQSDPSLLAAALLHDVGKARHPLRPWERVLIVLAQALSPGWADRLGASKPTGWRRPFAVAKQHPRWGAEMVAEVGGSQQLIELIRSHQDEPESLQNSDIINHLRALQAADSQN